MQISIIFNIIRSFMPCLTYYDYLSELATLYSSKNIDHKSDNIHFTNINKAQAYKYVIHTVYQSFHQTNG